MRRIQNLENHDFRERHTTARAETTIMYSKKIILLGIATLRSGEPSRNERTEWDKNACWLWHCCLSVIWE